MILGVDVGAKNLAMCLWNPEDRQICGWALLNTAGTWAKDVYTALNNLTDDYFEGVQKVVIEHQPSKNPSMTRIMHYLEFYFVSKGLPVVLQDSKHKLLYASTTPWFPKDCADREWTYRQRKKLAVETIAAFVKDTDQPLRAMFEESNKKDDLADSALHAMAHATFGVLGCNESIKNQPKKLPEKIIARAPTEKQKRTGKLSAHNVKYLLKDVDDVQEALRDPKIKRALLKHFGTVENYQKLCVNLNKT